MEKITIGRINNPRAAQAFSDYMRTQGIDVTYLMQDGLYHLFINDPDVEDLTCAELRDFLTNPDDPKYLDASWNEGSTNFHNPINLKQTGSVWSSFWLRSGLVTRILVFLSVAVTLVTVFGSNGNITRWLTIADIFTWDG